jgi:heterotetrameric sarcosine oxidase delta subunit
MRLRCPLCGERPLDEFHYRGGGGLVRPGPGQSVDDWVSHVYVRDNICGPMHEHWRHAGGCGAWLMVVRDTTTHDIESAVLAKGVPA